MHADIPKFRTFFVIFEQFFIHSFRKHKKSPSSYYKEGTHFHSFISTGTAQPEAVLLQRKS